MASWKYDKRPLNDAPFVYFCTELISNETDENNNNNNNKNKNRNNNKDDNNKENYENNYNDNNDNNNNNNNNKMMEIYQYTEKVLKALKFEWGPAHIGKNKKYKIKISNNPFCNFIFFV